MIDFARFEGFFWLRSPSE